MVSRRKSKYQVKVLKNIDKTPNHNNDTNTYKKNNQVASLDLPYLYIYKTLDTQPYNTQVLQHYLLIRNEQMAIWTHRDVKQGILLFQNMLSNSSLGNTFHVYLGCQEWIVEFMATIVYSPELDKVMIRLDVSSFPRAVMTDFLSLYRWLFRFDIQKWGRKMSTLLQLIPEVDFPLCRTLAIKQYHPCLLA